MCWGGLSFWNPGSTGSQIRVLCSRMVLPLVPLRYYLLRGTTTRPAVLPLGSTTVPRAVLPWFPKLTPPQQTCLVHLCPALASHVFCFPFLSVGVGHVMALVEIPRARPLANPEETSRRLLTRR